MRIGWEPGASASSKVLLSQVHKSCEVNAGMPEMLLTIGLQERHTGWPRMGPFHAAMLLRSFSAAATQGLEERRADLEIRKHRRSFQCHFRCLSQWRPSHLKSCYVQAFFKHSACSERRRCSVNLWAGPCERRASRTVLACCRWPPWPTRTRAGCGKILVGRARPARPLPTKGPPRSPRRAAR